MPKLAKFVLARSAVGSLLRNVPSAERSYRTLIWAKNMNHFCGVYRTHAAALADVPDAHASGWNDGGIAGMIVAPTPPDAKMGSRDFPGLGLSAPMGINQTSTFAVLLWLSKILKPNMRLLDVGGAGGITYWTYRRYFTLPDGVVWTVADFPELVERGRASARLADARGLAFVTNLADAGDADIVIALGSMQYMPPADVDAVFDKASRSRAVIINKMPLSSQPEFWTLQNLRTTSCPYWIANGQDFTARIRRSGLAIGDFWEVPELSIEIPFHPKQTVERLSGLLLVRDGVELN